MARALDLHSRGQGFDSLILHLKTTEAGNGEIESGEIPEERLKEFKNIMKIRLSVWKVKRDRRGCSSPEEETL